MATSLIRKEETETPRDCTGLTTHDEQSLSMSGMQYYMNAQPKAKGAGPSKPGNAKSAGAAKPGNARAGKSRNASRGPVLAHGDTQIAYSSRVLPLVIDNSSGRGSLDVLFDPSSTFFGVDGQQYERYEILELSAEVHTVGGADLSGDMHLAFIPDPQSVVEEDFDVFTMRRPSKAVAVPGRCTLAVPKAQLKNPSGGALFYVYDPSDSVNNMRFSAPGRFVLKGQSCALGKRERATVGDTFVAAKMQLHYKVIFRSRRPPTCAAPHAHLTASLANPRNQTLTAGDATVVNFMPQFLRAFYTPDECARAGYGANNPTRDRLRDHIHEMGSQKTQDLVLPRNTVYGTIYAAALAQLGLVAANAGVFIARYVRNAGAAWRPKNTRAISPTSDATIPNHNHLTVRAVIDVGAATQPVVQVALATMADDGTITVANKATTPDGYVYADGVVTHKATLAGTVTEFAIDVDLGQRYRTLSEDGVPTWRWNPYPRLPNGSWLLIIVNTDDVAASTATVKSFSIDLAEQASTELSMSEAMHSFYEIDL